MPDELPPHVPSRRQELLLRVARNPEVCCCICLSKEDRRRAKRVFKIARRVGKAWEKEQRQREQEARAS